MSYSPFEGVQGDVSGRFPSHVAQSNSECISRNIRHVTLHVAVMKPEFIQAETFQIPLPDLIPCKLLSMALTIDLDHQLQLRAIEIYDVFVNRSLSQERVT
jgi:hypothetical protein